MRPLFAAALNFFASGLGYIYLRKRTPLGWLLITAELLVFAGMAADRPLSASFQQNPLMLAAGLVASVAFALDAYLLGIEENQGEKREES